MKAPGLQERQNPERCGSHVSLRHFEVWPICCALIDRADVVLDFRAPDSIRLGVAPLYTTFTEVYDAMQRLRDIASREIPDAAPARVT